MLTARSRMSGTAGTMSSCWESIDDYVYFQDPFIHMSKAFMPRKTFEDHWHQVMGGDRRKEPEADPSWDHCPGAAPERKPIVDRKPDLSALDFSKFGSLNLIVTQFDRYLLPFDFLDALQGIWQDGNVRPNAFIFLRRDGDGNLSGMEGSRLEHGRRYRGDECSDGRDHRTQPRHSRTGLAPARFLQSGARRRVILAFQPRSSKELAEKLLPNHSAVIAIVENVWERKLRDVAKRYGGQGDQSAADVVGGCRQGSRWSSELTYGHRERSINQERRADHRRCGRAAGRVLQRDPWQ